MKLFSLKDYNLDHGSKAMFLTTERELIIGYWDEDDNCAKSNPVGQDGWKFRVTHFLEYNELKENIQPDKPLHEVLDVNLFDSIEEMIANEWQMTVDELNEDGTTIPIHDAEGNWKQVSLKEYSDKVKSIGIHGMMDIHNKKIMLWKDDKTCSFDLMLRFFSHELAHYVKESGDYRFVPTGHEHEADIVGKVTVSSYYLAKKYFNGECSV
jgi:hypothetical protein